jgi:hypothetical protein
VNTEENILSATGPIFCACAKEVCHRKCLKPPFNQQVTPKLSCDKCKAKHPKCEPYFCNENKGSKKRYFSLCLIILSKSEKPDPAAIPSKQEQYEELQALKQVVLDMSEKMKDMSRQITELKEQ